MTLVDTSAWIEFLRATGSVAHRSVRRLIDEDVDLQTTDVVVMAQIRGSAASTSANS